MPGWHDATLQQQQADAFQMLGIIQEQHPDRTALFMQWKQMEWPILVDSLNLLGTEVVPRTLLIDEHGTIRSMRARPEHLEEFLATDFDPPAAGAATELPARFAADDRFLSEGHEALDEVIAEYARLVRQHPDDGSLRFRLGVAYRARYDSPARRPDDFSRAVQAWKQALELNPNQYIWRRRIQQYGPRLDKPYPFYDWVQQARTDIAARGETPVPLPVEPRGAEFAAPARSFDAASGEIEEPDPKGRIHRDDGLIRLEGLVVPDTSDENRAARIHLTFVPDSKRLAHWNNEVERLKVWVDAPAGWSADRRLIEAPMPQEAVSTEERHVELEVRRGETAEPGELTGYALYYVCEDVDGTCLYRRQDFRLKLQQ